MTEELATSATSSMEDAARTLEFDIVCRLAAACADSEAGQVRALACRPFVEIALVRRALSETTQMQSLVTAGDAPDLHGILAMDDIALRLTPDGSWLMPLDYLALARHLATCSKVRSSMLASDRPIPELAARAGRIAAFPHLETRIAKTFDPEGRVKDDASPELSRIRRVMAELDRRMKRTLDGLLSRKDVRDALSEDLVTLREGRHVLPVRAERRNAVPGVLRGRSGSGQTMFIEPQAIVSLGDEKLARVQDEEREVLSILQDLADALRPELPALVEGAAELAELDAIKGKARLGALYDGVVPKLDPVDVVFEIWQGCHPLLDPRLRPLLAEVGIESKAQGDVVPVTVALPAGKRTLVITGPNTGGKTATLKLVGLFHLMAQAGFSIPAGEGSSVRVFRTILADIGDEQSLTQSLSTFSSHVARIASFFQDLGPLALVVLDELGAGTDPREGEALGLALLQELDARGAHVVASTHYGGIKAYALGSPAVLSVAMEWDEETLRPTYRLVAGASGSSHALPIARRLRVPEEVLGRAERHLAGSETDQTRTVAELTRELATVREERDRLTAERVSLDAELRAAREISAEIRERKSRLSEERTAILAETKRRVRGIVTFVEEQSTKLLSEAARLSAPELKQRRKAILNEALESIEKPASNPDALGPELAPVAPEPQAVLPLEPAVGVGARLRSIGVQGVITAIDAPRDRLQVDVKGKRMWVATRDVDLVRPAKQPSRGGYTLSSSREQGAPPLPQELSLLGFRVEEAIDAADRYLDQAVMAGWPTIRIVHGFGTGKLRAALQEYLKKHPQVKALRPGGDGEGGGGATVVTLR